MERTIDELPDDDHPLFGSDDLAGAGHHHVVGRARRSDRHRRRRTRRRRRIAPILAVVLILVVVAGSIVALGKVRDRFAVADYTGNGQGFVRIAVQPGDGAEDIAASLVKVGAVKSARAFVNAAKKSGQAGDIQPGTYQVRLHSSGAAAMAAILDPANRLVSKVTIAEGRTEKQILAELAAKTGIGIADLNAASKQLGSLGLPPGYSATTAEGFLFPATYDFDPNDTAETELQSLTAQFAAETAKLDFVASAKSLGVTPYQALIVASLVESEAKFDQDRGKIARVIYNRLAAKMPIGIDAANRYGLAVLGKDPNSVTFKENSPYNVRLRTGLPPTPISNPGINSLKAAVNPDAGNWLYYVVSDAAGHHFFTNDPNAFEAARQKCQANGWGC